MNCTDCHDQFTEILDDDGSGDMGTTFKAHLASCSSCATEFKSFKRTVYTLQHIPQQNVPADFLMGINEKLDSSTLARLKNWFSFLGQHKLTTSATMATLIVGVISATVLQPTPNTSQIQLAQTSQTYTQAISTQTETKTAENNYYPGVPYLTGKQAPPSATATTPIVQFASANLGATGGYYGIQPTRGSPQPYPSNTYTSLHTSKLTSTSPVPDFHIIIHPASAVQQQTITRQVAANTDWKTYLNNATLFVTLTDTQLQEFQNMMPPSAPPHKRLDFSPLTENKDRHLFTIAISFK